MANLKARRIHADERQTVIVVESVGSRRETTGNLFGLQVWVEPFAVVALDATGAHAIDTNGNPLDLDRLILDADELGALLERTP